MWSWSFQASGDSLVKARPEIPKYAAASPAARVGLGFGYDYESEAKHAP